MAEPSAAVFEESPEPERSGDTLLRLENLSKQFPGTLALDRVNFDVQAGEVHVLFGENGAGKSTLIQVVAGVHRPSGGTIHLRGEPTVIHSVHHARQLGVSAVFQEFSLVPQLTVEENLFLGDELTRGPLLNKRALARQARETLDRLGFPLRPRDEVMYLSRAEQQMVEIAKAFRTRPNIMIFDEPTASLTERETDRLFGLIEQIKAEGIGIIYITHRMNEIKRIGDRITVLRDGVHIDTIPVEEASDQKLVELMTGRVIEQIFPHIERNPAETLLEVEGLVTAKHFVNDVSINVRRGEVVGLAGLVGSGKSDLGRACFGLERIMAGKITFDGDVVYDRAKHVNKLGPRRMLDRGIYYLPSDRRQEGLIMMQNVRENVALPSLGLNTFSNLLFLRRANERRVVRDIAQKLDLMPLNIERDPRALLGRQPAEGAGGQVAGARREALRLRRADGGRRRRRAGGDLRVHPRSLRGGCRRPPDLLGPAGNSTPGAPHLRDVPRRTARGAGSIRNLGGSGAAPLLREGG